MKKEFSNITVLIDIDDTIIDLLPSWCDWLNKLYKTNVKPEDIIEWNICTYFPTLTKNQIFKPLNDPLFWQNIKSREYSVEYLKKLIDDGFDVYLCSATYYETVYPKFHLVIQKYFSYIDWSKVIITSNKQMIKADFCIDDGVHNLIDGDYTKILMTQPHNDSYSAEENGMYRVSNLMEAYKLIHKLVKNES